MRRAIFLTAVLGLCLGHAARGADAGTPTMARAYPLLNPGVLSYAKLVELPDGALLRAGYLTLTEKDFSDLLAARYGAQGIPVQVFFDAAGEEVFRHEGFYPQEEIEKKLADMGIE